MYVCGVLVTWVMSCGGICRAAPACVTMGTGLYLVGELRPATHEHMYNVAQPVHPHMYIVTIIIPTNQDTRSYFPT